MTEWTETKRIRVALKRAAKCGSEQPGYSAADSAKAALALAKWEAAGDWSAVPEEVESIIMAMGQRDEIRQRLNEIAGLEGDALTEEIRTESDALGTEYRDTETKLRAAVAAEGDPTETRGETMDAEQRERIELRGRSRVGAFLLGALQGRMVSGAEAEYAAALNSPAGEIPMDLWESDRPRPEFRAATPAPSTGTGVTVAPVQPFVFAPSIAPRLGIDMPSVGSGGYSEMTITTSVPAAPKVKGADADDTAGALTPVTANPRRISARMTVTLEDIAAVGEANFESALRQNVSMALSDAYDGQAVNGNGTSPNVDGLINQLTDPANPTALAAFDDFVAAFAGQIDGLWSGMMTDVSIVTNVDAYKLAARTFRGTAANGGPVETAADYLRKMTGGFWTNKRMPATASMIARGIVYRMGRTGLRTACHPTWGTISIDDIYTSSRSGQRHFTVHALVGDKVLLVQPDAYDLVEFKVA